MDIEQYASASGRVIRENGTVLNYADWLANLNLGDISPDLVGIETSVDNIEGDINTIEGYLDEGHDRLTGGIKIINTDHYYIHRGIAYKAYIELATVAGTPVEYSFKTPAALYPHFKNMQMVALGGTLLVTIKRGTTANPLVINSAGVASDDITGPHNLNDNSSNATGVVILKTPTYTEAKIGADWFKIQVVGDTTNQFTSIAEISSNDNEEIVMKADTYYVIRLERIGSDSPGNILLTLFWYEEPQGSL